MELLRFFTAGNVDDGKSTLIGRLLFDSNSISTDIIDTLTKQSKAKAENADIDLALLTDGLRAEREQGITIDVAYKYFVTDKRKYIIADTPGHAQYTRNMFTGASNTDLAIILIDARNGITDQTKRHSIISSILGIPHVLICVNKMDLKNYDQAVFESIRKDYLAFAQPLGLKKISFIPVSALTGENVVNKSDNFSWYTDETLFDFLENVEIPQEEANNETRFQVQYVIRPQTQELHDYRGYAGALLSGKIQKGDKVRVFPIDALTTVEKIEKFESEVESAEAGEPIILHLSDDLDISRGSTFVLDNELPETANEIDATICWMDNKPFQKGQKLLFQQNSFRAKAAIKSIEGKIDIHTLDSTEETDEIHLNEFCKVNIKTAELVSFDSYAKNRKTGAFILINENTNNTVAAGVIN
jgi:sulfate adenylyltransferase subunit 1